MASREAKEALRLAQHQRSTAQDAAASLAKSTGGSVVQTQQEDIF